MHWSNCMTAAVIELIFSALPQSSLNLIDFKFGVRRVANRTTGAAVLSFTQRRGSRSRRVRVFREMCSGKHDDSKVKFSVLPLIRMQAK